VVVVTVAWVLLAVVLAVTARQAHVARYPWKPCPRCSRGRQYSGDAHRDCPRCGATGRVRRWGAGRGE